MNDDPTFVLNAGTLAAVGGIMGTLSGCIAVLYFKLISAKDEQIKAKNDEIAQVRRERDDLLKAKNDEIEKITKERDYYLDRLFAVIEQAKQMGATANTALDTATRGLQRRP